MKNLPPPGNHLGWRKLHALGIYPETQFPYRLCVFCFSNCTHYGILGLPFVGQLVKNPPAMRETWVRSQGWEDLLEKGKAIHSSILAWRIPWTVSSMGSQRVGHEWATFTSLLYYHRQIRTLRIFFFNAKDFGVSQVRQSRCREQQWLVQTQPMAKLEFKLKSVRL